jgi:hypothetical protein
MSRPKHGRGRTAALLDPASGADLAKCAAAHAGLRTGAQPRWTHSTGQQPRRFYRLLATDLVDPHPAVRIQDGADASVGFGPFPSVTTIKLVQAPGATPSIRPGTGAVDFFVTLRGDAVVSAVDASGNVSGSINCRVPPRPS